MTTPKPGMHRGVSHDEYSAWDALRFSTLKCFLTDTPAHAEYKLKNPTESDAMNMGSAVHCALLEPEAFETRYVVAPQLDRRTKAGKTTWEMFQQENSGRITLLADEYDKCHAIAEGARKHPTCRALLAAPGQREVSLLWVDESARRMKCRLDLLVKAESGVPTLADVKTCRSLEDHFLERQFWNLGYDVQAAHYLAGADALAPLNRDFVFICVENTPPYLARPVRLTEQLYLAGVERRQMCIDKYAHAMETGLWPGYPVAALEVDVPGWIKPRETDDE